MIDDIEKLKLVVDKDFFLFCKYVMDFKDLEVKPHKEICDFLIDKSRRKKLLLLPRGSFKTSLCSIALPIFLLKDNPDLRIYIETETFENAKFYTIQIKTILEKNELFKTLYGDWSMSKFEGKWRDDGFFIKPRTDYTKKEPSICCGSIDVVKVGFHFDVIIMDDLHSEMNTQTKEQIQKVINHYRYMLSVLEPDGYIYVVGTRWNYSDLYGWILENSNDYATMIKSAILEDGSLFFEKRLSREFLETQKKEQGRFIFSCQYMNSPIPQEDRVFKEEFIQFIDSKKIPALSYYMTIDPSTGFGDDYSGVVIAGMSENRDLYVVYARKHKFNPTELCNYIIELIKAYRPIALGIESNSFQKTLKFYLVEELMKRELYTNIIELKTQNKSKESRILRLVPFFENKKIFIKEGCEDLIGELIDFPKGKYDDIIDALSYILDIIKPTYQISESEVSQVPIIEASDITGYF